jgi:hypothetical protein
MIEVARFIIPDEHWDAIKAVFRDTFGLDAD